MKNKNNVHPLLHALLPVGITLLYILIGFTCKSGWAIGWILFLLIPIIETLINAINTKDASKFAYPVFVTAIFIFTGMMWGWWHPMWVVFITIPAYYAIADYFKKSNEPEDQQIIENDNPTTYYQPPVNVQPQQKNGLSNKSKVAIIITSIVAIAVVACVAIVSTFSWLSGSFKLPIHIHAPAIISTDADDSYTMGDAELDTDGIEIISAEWIDGNVNIEYYDGDKISISENRSTEKTSMCYKVENGTLYICEYKNNVKKGFSNLVSKDLTIKLPKDFTTDVIKLEIVSANVNASDLNTLGVDIETVSGTANLYFAKQPQSIDVESVSGDVNLNMPNDITGYTVEKESVSGSFRANDFDNELHYGDGFTKIDFESVSGNLIINKK